MAAMVLLRPLTASGGCCRWQELLGGLAEKPKLPKGLYIYGGVGTGKTMLMDLLAESAPPEFQVCLCAVTCIWSDNHLCTLGQAGKVHAAMMRHQSNPIAVQSDQA